MAKRNLLPRGQAGNRLTVNGVLMHMKKVKTILKRGKLRFYSFLDVEMEGTSSVVYDVTRKDTIKPGIQYVRKEILRAIVGGLKQTGICDRMDFETKKLYKVLDKRCS